MPVLTLVTEQALAPVPGGTGRYTVEVGRALVRSAPADWQIRGLSAWHRDVGPARISGVAGPTRIPVPRRALTALWEQGLGPRVPGDVVHATTPLAPTARRLRRGALVVTVHDAVPFSHPELLTPRGASWHRRTIAQAARTADAVVVPTEAVRHALDAWVDLDTRVEVIGEGVAEAFLDPVPPLAVEHARAKFGLPERYLVAVGTLEPRKGLSTIIEALPLLPHDVHLAIVGPSGWGDAAPPTAERVHLLGRLSDADLAAVVAGAVLSVHASREEGFGLPLVEAMAAGTPVLHSDIPVFREVAGSASATFAVDDVAALASEANRLLSSPVDRATAVAAGRLVAARHRWEDTAARLWSLYTDLTPPSGD